VFGALLGYIFFEITVMKEIEDNSAMRSKDLLAVSEMLMNVDEFYTIIADGIINRNLKKTDERFNKMKSDIISDMETAATPLRSLARERIWSTRPA
jgi:hypothetical protein